MFRNYFKIAIRNILRSKVYSFINITGLAIGMASAILIMLWVQNELSYDAFHKNKDDIFRIHKTTIEEDESETPYPLVEDVKIKLPEVVYSTFFMRYPRVSVSNGDKKFYEERVAIAGEDYFNMFSFQFIEGNPASALSAPNSIVILESVAKKYFGTASMIGKTITLVDNSFTVTGVIRDVSEQSHMQFDFLMSRHYLEKRFKNDLTWENSISRCYIQLAKGTDVQRFTQKMNEIYLKNVDPSLVSRLQMKITLRPLTDIHLSQSILNYIYIFSILAFFILFIACINYVNLSTALSARRSKEVGLRKVIAANRTQLLWQFLGETIVHVMVASIFAGLIVWLCMPLFIALTGKHIAINILGYQHIGILIGVMLLTAILASSYPAILLSSFNPVHIFKGNRGVMVKSGHLRGALVILQYSISIGLLICTMIVSMQLRFIRTKDLGYAKDSFLYIPFSGKLLTQYEAFRTELMNTPGITGVTSSLYLPTAEGRNRTSEIEWEGKNPNLDLTVEQPSVDYNFFEVLGLKIVQGRNFSKEYSTDATSAIIFNEEAINRMGIKDPIGKEIVVQGIRGTIIGIVRNAHFLPLLLPIEPQAFTLLHDFNTVVRGVILIKAEINNKQQRLIPVISSIEKFWNKFNPEQPFEYHLWGESINSMYKTEDTIGNLFTYFATLAIILSCFGLFSLASFNVENHKKEIGVRKVLGASITGVVTMLLKEFTKWVLLANIISWPVAYYFMNRWLQEFAYRINIGFTPFILSAGLALMIALLTVSYQTLRAAFANPVDSLRYE